MRLVVRHNLRRERRPGVVAASRRCGNIWALACSDTARVRQGDNPFAALYRRWIAKGLSSKLARRNVARALATTLWGLWKNGSACRQRRSEDGALQQAMRQLGHAFSLNFYSF